MQVRVLTALQNVQKLEQLVKVIPSRKPLKI